MKIERRKHMKKIWKFLKNPPILFLFFIYLITFGFCMISIVFLIIDINEILSNIIFVFAGITVFYTIFTFILNKRKIKKCIIRILSVTPITKRYVTDYGFRLRITTTIAFITNAAYAIFEGVMALIGRSIWYASLCAYHSILWFMRYNALKKDGIIYKTHDIKLDGSILGEIKKWRVYQNIGIDFLIIVPSISISIWEMIFSNRHHIYAGMLIYVVSAYTFYKITIAILNIFKVQKYYQPIWQSIRNINLADAAMSILSLQVALIATFSNNSDMKALNMATGSVVSIAIIIMAIFMIINSRNKIKVLQYKMMTNE